ncbi:MAG: ATP-binding cassette domain-containing protein [Chloroflexi bacterium]|nr:ATP-binding cassette domain-containing protein [Chloroflexota bacterium]MDQ3400597.1 ATP-binding cassette domain-containing protein [Chloroflexota bacterium]
MTAPVVHVRGLTKIYRVHERATGLGATFRSLVKRTYKDVPAVSEIDFGIASGEVVGFLGPNGAGKTTTLKMLSGLLFPTSGEASVLGHVPWRREDRFLRRMTLLMGNRTQLVWDIPAADSFLVLKQIYDIGDAQYRETLDELTELLELGPLLHKPVRQLSLGERMKVEFAAGLLHRPEVVFLDEPTLGLDVSMQARIRTFIRELNRRSGGTILLTSHYMDDIVALCRRVIVIHHGRILYDGGLADLAERMAPYKLVGATLRDGALGRDLSAYGDVVSSENGVVRLRVPRAEAAERTARLVRDLESGLADLSVEDPPIEEVIDRVFSGEQVTDHPSSPELAEATR